MKISKRARPVSPGSRTRGPSRTGTFRRHWLPAALVALTAALGVAGAAPASAAAGPSWSLVSSPNVLLSRDGLGAVSCPNAGFCMAVGLAVAKSGGSELLAKSWNGHAWTRHAVPLPAHATYGSLSAVSCTSARSCLAVGQYLAHTAPANTSGLAERWNGKTWRVALLTANGFFNAVSCSAYNACTVVGGTGRDDDVTNEVAERWNGRSWTRQRVPAFSGPSGIAFTGVTCSSATACIAVGYDWNLGDGTMPIAARWLGGKWAALAIPDPAPDGETEVTVTAMSCSSARACTAIGYATDPGGETFLPLAERWNGRRWAVQQVPGSVSFGGISCPAATMCLAVSGQQTDRWNGATWAVDATAKPAVGGSLGGIACRTATLCVGVGSVSIADGGSRTLAERWNGTTWSVQATPGNPAGAQTNDLASVSCPVSSACMAVGWAGSVMLAAHWNGSRWSLRQPPAPAGATSSRLTAVSCPTATACVAVGADQQGGAGAALTEHWNGTSWSALASPAGLKELSGIWCASATVCMAVGSGTSGAKADIWNGSTWTAQPLAAGMTSLTSVSCSAVSACMAVGSEVSEAAAEYWNGTVWTLQAVPPGGKLAAVSCPAANDCTAVGPRGTVDYWNGATWSAQPSATINATLGGVSCVSRSACTAVGGRFRSNSPLFPTPLLVERWNGSRWFIQRASAPRGDIASALQGVSCASARACIAVGNYRTGQRVVQTLAERYS